MKYKNPFITGACLAALAFSGTIQAKEKKSEEPAADTAATTEMAAKPPRPIPFHGKASAIDKSEKTFTIAGALKSRVVKVTDKTVVTKDGNPAVLTDLAENEAVSGSYWKHEDGTLEAKSLKIGGKSEAEKAAAAAKKMKKTEAAAEEPTAPAEGPAKKK